MIIALNNTWFINSAFHYRSSLFLLARHSPLCELVIKVKALLKKTSTQPDTACSATSGDNQRIAFCTMLASCEREINDLLLLRAPAINPADKIGRHYPLNLDSLIY